MHPCKLELRYYLAFTEGRRFNIELAAFPLMRSKQNKMDTPLPLPPFATGYLYR